MNVEVRPLSVTAPLGPAVERVRTVLFHPFDLGRWLVIGFCAWLAILGQGGGVGGGGNFNFGNRHRDFGRALDQAREYIVSNLGWLVPLVVGLSIVCLAIWVVIVWLSSRGQFMFLHCVVTNRAEVRAPWSAYPAEANSLCLFRLMLGLAGLLCIMPAVGGILLPVVIMVSREDLSWGLVLVAVAFLLAVIGLGLAFSVVAKLTRDFVVPIMALRRSACRAAWREFLQLSRGHGLDLVLYLVFQVVLAVVVGAALVALALLTCCVAGCLMALPYVGTVLLLPVYVFDRAYSVHFLAQFGPAWELIQTGAPPQP